MEDMKQKFWISMKWESFYMILRLQKTNRDKARYYDVDSFKTTGVMSAHAINAP